MVEDVLAQVAVVAGGLKRGLEDPAAPAGYSPRR